MTEATLELFGTIQRFFGWLRKDADLYSPLDQEGAREIASQLSTDIENLIDVEDVDTNKGE